MAYQHPSDALLFLLQEYEKFGAAFEGKPDVVIAKVDADAHKDLGSRFSVQGFPTLKFFVDGQPEECVSISPIIRPFFSSFVEFL